METGEWRNLKAEEINGLLSGKNNSKVVSDKKIRRVVIKKRGSEE